MMCRKENLFHRTILISLVLGMTLFLTVFSAKADSVVFAFENYNYELMVGKKTKLTPILQGADLSSKAKYTWESEDTSIANVSKGSVTAKAAGSTRISCTVQDRDVSYTASCTVHVLQPVTKIQFDEKDWKMAEGQSKVWQPEVLPENAYNKQLRFSSSEPSVATISNTGVIKALDRGITTITAEAMDGSGVKLQKKLTVVTFLLDFDEIVLTERKTYELQLPILERPNNLNAYYIGTKNQNFELGNIYIDKNYKKDVGIYGDSARIQINPVKAGVGTLIIMDDNACFGYKGVKTSHSIAVRIEPSATYSKESFPPIDFSVLSKDARACVGNVVSVQGIVTNVEILPVDKNYVQILYTVSVNGKQKNSIEVITPPLTKMVTTFTSTGENSVSSSSSLRAGDYAVGEKVTVYGAYIEPVTYTTETGLSMQKPRIQIEKINDICYNHDLHKLKVHDITRR